MSTTFEDRTLTCRDCGQSFTFTAGEQEFYQARGLTNDPGRCANCRAARRSGRSSGDDRGAGGASGGGGYVYSTDGSERPRDAGFAARPRREMHSATCSSCGKEAQVPFVPRGDKPVYCSDCFETQRANR